jgi:hypothetical protein
MKCAPSSVLQECRLAVGLKRAAVRARRASARGAVVEARIYIAVKRGSISSIVHRVEMTGRRES